MCAACSPWARAAPIRISSSPAAAAVSQGELPPRTPSSLHLAAAGGAASWLLACNTAFSQLLAKQGRRSCGSRCGAQSRSCTSSRVALRAAGSEGEAAAVSVEDIQSAKTAEDVGPELLRQAQGGEITDRELANIVWSAFRRKPGNRKLMTEAVQLLTKRIQTNKKVNLRPQDMPNVMHAAGMLGTADCARLQKATAEVVKGTLSKNPGALRHNQALRILKSVARMQRPDWELIEALTGVLRRTLLVAPHKFRANHSSDALWVTAKMQRSMDAEWVSTIAAETAGRLGKSPKEFGEKSLATIVWSAAKLSLTESDQLVRMAADVTATRLAETPADFRAHSLSKILWSAATLNLKGDELVGKAAHVACKRLSDAPKTFDEQGLSNIMLAAAKLEMVDSELVQTLAPVIVARLAESAASNFTEQGLANIMSAAANLEMVDSELVQTLAPVIAAKLAEATAGNFKEQELSSIMRAAAKLEMVDSELVQTLAPVIAARLAESADKFQEHQLSNIWLAAAKLEMVDSELVQTLAPVIVARLGESADMFQEQGLANIMWATEKLEMVDSELGHALARARQTGTSGPSSNFGTSYAPSRHANPLQRARGHRKKVLRECFDDSPWPGIANISFVPGFEHLDPLLMKESCDLMLQLHNDTRFWRDQLKESPYGAVQLFRMLPGAHSERFTSAEALAEYLVDEQKHAPPPTEEAEMYWARLARMRERYAHRWEAFNERKTIVESYLGNIRGISKVAERLGQTNFSFVNPRTLVVVCEWLKDKWGEEAARDLVQKDRDGFARFCEQPMKDIHGCKHAFQSLEDIAAKIADSKARQPPEST